MTNNVFRKSLIIGIIILSVGASVFPNTINTVKAEYPEESPFIYKILDYILYV